MTDGLPTTDSPEHTSGDGPMHPIEAGRRQVRLLIVDTNPTTCPAIVRATRGAVQVVGRPDAASASATLRRQSFDVVIVRLRAANADRMQLIRELATNGPQDHTVVISANAEDVQAARSLGVLECLSPACRAAELRGAIARCAQAPRSEATNGWISHTAAPARGRRTPANNKRVRHEGPPNRGGSLGLAVLVVGDDPATNAIIREAAGVGARIVTHSEDLRALEELKRTRFDVLVLTLDRPDGSRAAFLRRVRGERRPNRVVALTRGRRQNFERFAPEVTAMLPKRCSANELRQAMFGSST